MDIEYEKSGTPARSEKYGIQSEDNSNSFYYVSNVENLPSEAYVETLIIVVEGEDKAFMDVLDPKYERNTPEIDEVNLSHIKQELPADAESEYFTIENDLEFKVNEHIKNESLKAHIYSKVDQYYAGGEEWNRGHWDHKGDFLDLQQIKIENETMRKAIIEDDEVAPNYHPMTDSNNDSKLDIEFILNSYENKSKQYPDKKRFSCSICRKSFSRQCLLKLHLTSHHEKKSRKYDKHPQSHTKQPSSCKMCGKLFTWRRNLNNHVKKQHSEDGFKTRDEKYQCYHCEAVYWKRQLLVKHMRVHKEMRTFRCTVCPESFNLEHALKWHQVVHSRGEYRCPVCQESFAKLRCLTRHRFQFHRRWRNPCTLCFRSFKLPSSLLKHLKKHQAIARDAGEDNRKRPLRTDDDEGPFLCEICGVSLSLAKFFDRHKHLHQKPFQCEVCGSRFTRQQGLQQHFQSHSEKAKLQCELCGKRFLLKSHLSRHMKKHVQEPASFLCDTCGKSFSTKDSFLKHSRIHRMKTFECLVCGKNFSLIEFYNDHMKRHEKRPFKCTLCHLDFTHDEHLKGHMQTHDEENKLNFLKKLRTEPTQKIRRKSPSAAEEFKSEEKVPHRCKICSKTFPFKSVLASHERMHSKVQSFRCPICSKILKTNLERHMKTHSEERPFECSVCKRGFRIRDQMYKHMKIHAVEPPFPCSICSRGFFSSFALALHRKAHSDGEPYQCKLCDGKFYQMSLLQTHLRTHTGDKPFQCEICEKRFGLKVLLARHQKNNPKKQSFSCPFCDSRFCFKRYLTAHINDRHGSSCSFCGKEYNCQYDLNRHVRTHTGDTPYECSVCQMRFTMKSTLNRHVFVHTGEKPFKCRVCQKSFRRNSHLKGHIERMHGEGFLKKPGSVNHSDSRGTES